MPRDELAIVAAIAITVTFVHADARSVRAGAFESIQSYAPTSSDRRSIDVHDDIDIDVDESWDENHISAGASIAAPSQSTGSMVYALPGRCVGGGRLGATYYNCNGVWYEPRFAGASITYVIVNPPRQITSSLVFENVAPQFRHER